MPLYEYECQRCAYAEDIVHPMAECSLVHTCLVCKAEMQRIIGMPRAIKPPVDANWEAENGGKGREITQFCGNKYKPSDPRNKRYFRSQNDLIEACKREGYTYEKTR